MSLETIYNNVVAHMATPGARFVIGTYTHARVYKDAADLKLSPRGDLYVRRGKNWDCVGQNGMMLVGLKLAKVAS